MQVDWEHTSTTSCSLSLTTGSFGCQRRVQVWIHQAILWFGRALQEIQGSWLYYCWMSL